MPDISLLNQLKDIHLPASIGCWPWALGWWLLLLSLPVLMIVCLALQKPYRSYCIKRLFLLELEDIKKAYQKHQNASMALKQLADLLKRVALMAYPRQQVASLHGQAWVQFLQDTSKRQDMSEILPLLQKSLYQPDVTADISVGFKFVKHWIYCQRLRCMN